MRKTGEKKKLQFIIYYTTYLNRHFWEPKMFTVQCWHKISFTRSAKAKNKVVCRRNCDLIFTVSSQSREGHRIGEREQLQQNIIKFLIFGFVCKNPLSLSKKNTGCLWYNLMILASSIRILKSLLELYVITITLINDLVT